MLVENKLIRDESRRDEMFFVSKIYISSLTGLLSREVMFLPKSCPSGTLGALFEPFPRRFLLPDNEQQVKCTAGIVNHDVVLMPYIGYQTAVIGLQLVSIPAI